MYRTFIGVETSAEWNPRKFVFSLRGIVTAVNEGVPQTPGMTEVDSHLQAQGAHTRKGERERVVCPVFGG